MAEQSDNLEFQRKDLTFPLPPPFWKDFTDDNVVRFEAIKARHTLDNFSAEGSSLAPGDVSKHRIPLDKLPEDLINLQPPAPPDDGKWRCFGQLYTLDMIMPSLEAAGIERAIPENMGGDAEGPEMDGYQREIILKRLAKSLLLNFLETVTLLAKDPNSGMEKAQDIKSLLFNLHHAINEYRPHQARESLIALMQDQLDRMRDETQANREAADKARRVLEGLISIEIPDDRALLPPLFPASLSKEGEEKAPGDDADREAWMAADSVDI